MEEKNIALVRELYSSFNQGDDCRIAQLLSQDIRWNQMDGFPGRGRCVGITECSGMFLQGCVLNGRTGSLLPTISLPMVIRFL